MSRDCLRDIVILAVSLGLFGALSLDQLGLPGLYYDEAVDAVPAMQLVLGQPTTPVRGASVVLGDRVVPLMAMDYVGPVNTLLLLPFFALGGVNVVSVRLMPILAAAATLGLTYLWGRQLFSRRAAAMAALLLAVQPSFVFFSRQGIHVTSVMSLLAVGGLYSLWRWHNQGRPGLLYLAAFILGVGLAAKILFLWFILAAAVVYVVLRRLKRGRPIPWAQGIGAGTLFLLGASPLLVYNLQTQGTLEVVGANLMRSQEGINNLDVVSNLLARLDSLRVLLEGRFFWFLGGPFGASAYPYLLGVVVVSGMALSWWRKAPHWGRLVFVAGFVGLILVQSVVTISGLWATHLYALLPFLMLLLGAGLAQWAGLGQWGAVGAAVVLVVLLGMSLEVDGRYHQAMSITGGLAHHSDAIYQLSDFLERRGEETVAMDWGLAANLQLLTQGRVAPQEVFGYSAEPDAGFAHRLYPQVAAEPRLFLFHTPPFTVYPRFEAFTEWATRWGKKVVLEKAIAQRDGTPLFLVYQVEDQDR